MDVIAGSQVLVPEETRVVTPLPTPSGWHLLEMSFKAPNDLEGVEVRMRGAGSDVSVVAAVAFARVA
jgi:hypothetical protein